MPTSFFGVSVSSPDYAGQGLSIKGLQEAQERNLRRIVHMQPGGIRGQAVKIAADDFYHKLIPNTPVKWGALRASRRITFNSSIPRAQVFTSGNAYNPRSNTPPAEYDVYLHARGHKPGLTEGWQDSFPTTMRENGQRIVNDMAALIARAVRNP